MDHDHDTLTPHDDPLMADRVNDTTVDGVAVDGDGTAAENQEHGREAVGAGAGALGGAAVGMAVGGPVGAVVGGGIGAVAGAVAGEAAEGDDEGGSGGGRWPVVPQAPCSVARSPGLPARSSVEPSAPPVARAPATRPRKRSRSRPRPPRPRSPLTQDTVRCRYARHVRHWPRVLERTRGRSVLPR